MNSEPNCLPLFIGMIGIFFIIIVLDEFKKIK